MCRDITPWVIYGRIQEPAKSVTRLNYDIFSQPLDYSRPLADTNLHQHASLPPPLLYYLTSLHTVFNAMRDEDRKNFRSRYTLEVQIGYKIYHQVPLSLLEDGQLVEEPSPYRPGELARPGRFPNDWPLVVPCGILVKLGLVGHPFMLKGDLNAIVAGNGLMRREVQ
jgi:hypothetical protein